jgi:hypothetical protein
MVDAGGKSHVHAADFRPVIRPRGGDRHAFHRLCHRIRDLSPSFAHASHCFQLASNFAFAASSVDACPSVLVPAAGSAQRRRATTTSACRLGSPDAPLDAADLPRAGIHREVGIVLVGTRAESGRAHRQRRFPRASTDRERSPGHDACLVCPRQHVGPCQRDDQNCHDQQEGHREREDVRSTACGIAGYHFFYFAPASFAHASHCRQLASNSAFAASSVGARPFSGRR